MFKPENVGSWGFPDGANTKFSIRTMHNTVISLVNKDFMKSTVI